VPRHGRHPGGTDGGQSQAQQRKWLRVRVASSRRSGRRQNSAVASRGVADPDEGSSNAGKSVVTSSSPRRPQQRLQGRVRLRIRPAAPARWPAEPDITDFLLAPSTCTRPAAMDPGCRQHRLPQLLAHLRQLQGRFDVVFTDSMTSFVSQPEGRRSRSSRRSRSTSTRT
jgi:hypothetical protein